jgi:hypothetical protein
MCDALSCHAAGAGLTQQGEPAETAQHGGDGDPWPRSAALALTPLHHITIAHTARNHSAFRRTPAVCWPSKICAIRGEDYRDSFVTFSCLHWELVGVGVGVAVSGIS